MRIVSLVPSHTETLYEIGVWDQVVGVTSFCVRPEGAREAKRVVGGTKSPSVERIQELEPDLAVVVVEENPREAVEELEAAGTEVLVTDVRDVDDAEEAVRRLGQAVGARPEAEAIVDRIQRARAEVRQQVVDRAPVRVFCPIWRDPWMALSGDTYAAALLEEAGAEHPWAKAADRYPEVTLEEVREAEVDLVLLPSEPYAFEQEDRDEIVERLGLEPRAVRLVDGQALTWYGARTPEGLRTVAEAVEAGRSGER